MYYKIKQVYDAIYDEKSKEIFINRFINNLTGDGNYIVNIINDNCKKINGNTIGKYYKEKNYEKKLIIYGAMMSGKVRYDLHNYLKRDDIFCFCDKDINKQKSGFCGKKVISPEELVSKYTDYKVIIETKYYYDEVYKFLMDNNFPVENIILHGDNGCQYLDYEYMNFTDNEVMIDGGCYDCETIEYFIDKVKKYKKVIAFEPDKLNYKNCKKIVKDKNLLNVEIINGGLWNENCTLSFCGEGDSCSRIAENGSDSCQVYAIDNFREAQESTFIKMDI